jgi:hypothetical protein
MHMLHYNLSKNILKAKKMGYIKEPDGVDFEINSRPLTKEEEIAISEFILNYKARQTKKQSSTRQRNPKVAATK